MTGFRTTAGPAGDAGVTKLIGDAPPGFRGAGTELVTGRGKASRRHVPDRPRARSPARSHRPRAPAA